MGMIFPQEDEEIARKLSLFKCTDEEVITAKDAEKEGVASTKAALKSRGDAISQDMMKKVEELNKENTASETRPMKSRPLEPNNLIWSVAASVSDCS